MKMSYTSPLRNIQTEPNKNLSTEFDLIDLVYKDELDKMCFLKQYYKIK